MYIYIYIYIHQVRGPRPLPHLRNRQARLGETEFFIPNLLVRILFIIVMNRWTGLAPWEFESPFHRCAAPQPSPTPEPTGPPRKSEPSSSSLLLSSLELSDTTLTTSPPRNRFTFLLFLN